MMYLLILCATLAVTIAQVYSQKREEVNTIIQNKNVNIIVNLDPQEVAKELWKVIEARLSNHTGHITNSKNAIKELEKAVTPFVSPTRRGISQSAFQVASQLDKITRRTLTRDKPTMDMLDEEIMTRDIVADMMTSLKMILSKTIQSKIDEIDVSGRRAIHSPVKMYDDEDDYVNVRIKMRRKDIVDAIH
ncbi:unnamed protein product [Lasius platythorax]|uniref:Uncharacterized protein n=2 Tax=Lasius TaxID=488720 RepID=A0AAV2NPL3_9HYME